MYYYFNVSCVVHDGERVLLINGDDRVNEGYLLPTSEVGTTKSFVEVAEDIVKRKTGLTVKNLSLRVIKHTNILEAKEIYLIFTTTNFKGKLTGSSKWVLFDNLKNKGERIKEGVADEVMAAVNGYPSEVRYYLDGLEIKQESYY